MASDSSATRGGTFASLQNRDYKVLWWAGLFSFMSVQMQFLLRGILAWDLTESERSVGTVYFFFGVSMLITTLMGGVAADRLPKRLVLLVSQSFIALAAVGMGIAVVSGQERFWMLLVAAVMQGGSFGFLGPARVAFSSELVGRDQIGNAIALTMLSMNGTRVFAPTMAGILAGITFIGIGGAYLVAGACSVLSLVAMVLLPAGKPIANAAPKNPVKEVADGIRYVASVPRLRRLVLMSTIVIMFGFNYVSFVPVYVKDIFGESDAWVGYLSSVGAVGAVVSALFVASHADSPRARQILVVSGLAFGALVVALAYTPSLLLALLIMVVLGAANTAYQSVSATLAITDSDPEYQGRVQSLMQLSFAGFGLADCHWGNWLKPSAFATRWA
ncbi:MAG: MFS transporter [Acidimicrobiales bacterium]